MLLGTISNKESITIIPLQGDITQIVDIRLCYSYANSLLELALIGISKFSWVSSISYSFN
jgi:hypothetical protein